MAETVVKQFLKHPEDSNFHGRTYESNAVLQEHRRKNGNLPRLRNAIIFANPMPTKKKQPEEQVVPH